MMGRAPAWTVVFVIVCVLMSQVAIAQTTGKISAVRVYQGQALVTRDVQLQAKIGAQEVTVTDLPARIVPDSLYATSGEGIAIRAVRFRATASAEEARPEVRVLDQQIKAKVKEENRVASELAVLEARGSFLDSLEQFAATKVDGEMRRGSLNPGSLAETATFIFDQRDDIAAKILKLETESEDIEEALSVLQRRRAALTPGAARTLQEAVVFLDAAKAGPAEIQLSYLVYGVGWSPAYSVRLAENRERMGLEYQAVVTQMSGEDWPDVALTLSTSHPRMLAAAPILSPLRISLVTDGQQANELADREAYNKKRRDLEQQIRSPQKAGPAGPPGPRGERGPVGGAGMMGGGMMMGMAGGGMMGMAGPPGSTRMPSADEQSLTVNVLAAQLQNIELTAPDDVVRMSRAVGSGATEGLAVDYPIPGRISIQSRADQQMFHIATLDLAADFRYVAVPLLTDYVYQAVECVNTSEYPLLAGPYNAYLAGAFAGRGDLPLVARGQSLGIGFGTETQLRTARELQKKETTIRGGNKIVKYTYCIRVHNYMDKPAQVQVWGRLPQAPDKQVTIALADPDPALSEDALYVSQQRPRGLLRWDVEVPAGAARADAYSFTYEFTVEFDKNYDIGELPAGVAEVMRKDIRMMRSIQTEAAME